VVNGVPPLEVLKALGDNTRYAIYLELLRSPRPLATAELADALALHPNTVRPHLERMRDVGLLDVEVDGRGEVGRPQHRYSVAADAPSFGFEPPATTMLATMLADLASVAGISSADAAAIGRRQGIGAAGAYVDAPSCLEALVGELDTLGFDPVVETGADGETAVVAFSHCPFRSLAEAYPELVCSLHRGLVEGFVDAMGDAEVGEFCTLAARTPCQVALVSR
jgi:predicted ArsR family transcriptional regulator